METTVPVLNVLAWVGLAIFVALGFAARDPMVRILVLSGAFASAMLAAAKGLIQVAPYFISFPVGFAYLGGGPAPEHWALGCGLGGFFVYLGVSVAYVSNRLEVARPCWIALTVLLLLNISGCHQMLEEVF